MVSQMMLSKQLCSTRQATATASSISGRPLVSRPQQCRTPARRGGPIAAETKEKESDKKEGKKEEKAPFKPPALDPNTPSPIFGGSTGGLLRKAQVEEFYVITWEGKKEAIFEMPTGGAAAMRQGPNLLKLARKEQCLALLTQLRNKFKLNGQFYRVFPNGEVQYLHPKDGQYPEKVTPGRQATNTKDRRIGDNTNPVKVKFTGKLGTFDV